MLFLSINLYILQMLKLELQRAEGELEDRCWSPPAGLQHWLQMTHEIENKAYTNKKIAAEKQLQQAREAVTELTFSNHFMQFHSMFVLDYLN